MADGDILSFAQAFYGLKSTGDTDATCLRSTIPFITAFEDVTFLSTTAAKALMSGGKDAKADAISRNVLLLSLSLLDALVSRLDHESDVPFVVDWEPAGWLSAVLICIQQKVRRPQFILLFVADACFRPSPSLPWIA